MLTTDTKDAKMNDGLTSSLRLGISSCLLGEEVRFNGGHTRDTFLTGPLGQYVEWIPICPEVEIGMGVPRENIRLIGDIANPTLIAPKSKTDYTESMNKWSESYIKSIKSMNLDGYVFKSDSPSCGLYRVRVYENSSVATRKGRGLFARKLTDTFPLLPTEEEGRLHDSRLRENFVEKIFVYHRWKQMVKSIPDQRNLILFHAIHKSILMSHHQNNQKELGRIVANVDRFPINEVIDRYENLLMVTLNVIPTNKRHANVLHHLMGFLKTYLDSNDKQELLELIDEYRMGKLPIVVPITLMKHHINRNPVENWIKDQVYLNPFPNQLGLRVQI